VRWLFTLNRLPQNSQRNGFSSVWLWMCLTRSLLLWNALLQYWHVWDIWQADLGTGSKKRKRNRLSAQVNHKKSAQHHTDATFGRWCARGRDFAQSTDLRLVLF
jgi:hypothetical protein